jgi:hypothetical protein
VNDKPTTQHRNKRHSTSPWLNDNAILLANEDVNTLSPQDRNIYETYLYTSYFQPLSDNEVNTLSHDKKIEYKNILAIVNSLHTVTSTSPLDVFTNQPLVACQEIDLKPVVTHLSDFILTMMEAVEVEATLKVKSSQELGLGLKNKLTTQVEDRLRAHWPRRGRCETEIRVS